MTKTDSRRSAWRRLGANTDTAPQRFWPFWALNEFFQGRVPRTRQHGNVPALARTMTSIFKRG